MALTITRLSSPSMFSSNTALHPRYGPVRAGPGCRRGREPGPARCRRQPVGSGRRDAGDGMRPYRTRCAERLRYESIQPCVLLRALKCCENIAVAVAFAATGGEKRNKPRLLAAGAPPAHVRP